MFRFSNISLRWRLLAAFLLSAVLTVLAGGGGIFSLRQIQSDMSETSTDVDSTVTHQIAQTRTMMTVYSLADQIRGARSLADLDLENDQLTSLVGVEMEDANSSLNLEQSIREFQTIKRTQLEAAMSLNDVKKRVNAKLAEVNSAIAKNADDISIGALKQIEEVIQATKERTKQDGQGLEASFEQISNVTDTAITRIRAALAVRYAIGQLGDRTKAALLFENRAEVEYTAKEFDTILKTIAGEIEHLPESLSVKAISEALPGLRDQVAGVLEVRLAQLENRDSRASALENQDNEYASLRTTLNDIGEKVLVAGEDILFQATETVAGIGKAGKDQTQDVEKPSRRERRLLKEVQDALQAIRSLNKVGLQAQKLSLPADAQQANALLDDCKGTLERIAQTHRGLEKASAELETHLEEMVSIQRLAVEDPNQAPRVRNEMVRRQERLFGLVAKLQENLLAGCTPPEEAFVAQDARTTESVPAGETLAQQVKRIVAEVKAVYRIRFLVEELNLQLLDVCVATDGAAIGLAEETIEFSFAQLAVERDGAAANETLAEILDALPGNNEPIARLIAIRRGLLESEQKHLATVQEVTLKRGKLKATFKTVNDEIATTVDDISFDTMIALQDTIDQAKGKRDEGETYANQGYDTLSTTADQALSQLKAALSIRASANELNSGLKDALLSVTLEGLDQARVAGDGLYQSIIGELEILDDAESKQQTLALMSQTQALMGQLVEAKKTMLLAQMNLQSTSQQLVRQTNTLNGAILQASQDLKASLHDRLATNSKVVARWQNILLVLSILAFGVALAIGIFMPTALARTVDRVVQRIKDIAEGEGDLTKRLDVTSRDEMGQLAKWINTFLEKLQRIIAEVSQNSQTLNVSSASMVSAAQIMSTGAEESSHASHSVASSVEQMNEHMNLVAVAMNQASTNVDSVAQAAQEMTNSIGSVKDSTKKASTITQQAVVEAEGASSQMNDLGDAAQSIGKVTDTITDISEQTNLLALNATIEAARAGDAGKGFAVVANEIKALANQTAKATDDIQYKIDHIQNAAVHSVKQIGNVMTIIGQIDDVVSLIASSVEEQFATTRQIADNAVQTSRGIKEVNDNVIQTSSVSAHVVSEMGNVRSSAEEISKNSTAVHQNASELSHLAETLAGLVGQFKV